jgi:iron complex transport system ATP-binding protein
MQTSHSPVLTLNSLEIGYFSGKKRNVLLPPLNAVANKGELIAVIGKNGIGKSTLLRTITGLQPGLGGEIIVKEKNIRQYSRMNLAQEVGYISTEIIKVSNMKVVDMVSLGRFPHTNWIGRIEREDENIILDSINKTSMAAYCSRFVSELSDGERQKVMIARILAQDTGIMVMDEPTAFLDIGSKYEILHLLHKLSRESQKTIIFSTHDLHMAISQADKIWLVLDDKLKEGAPEDLVIEGAFNHLFDSSPVQFSAENGTFTFRGEERGKLYIEGHGFARHWTCEAVKRAGFGVSEEMTDDFVKVIKGGKTIWRLISQYGSMDFYTVYDLIKHINDVYQTPI